jgi:ankyrin repeat protein
MTANISFPRAVQALKRGDFSSLEPLFGDPDTGRPQCSIVDWYDQGYFEREPEALAEALTCACFLGRTSVAEYLLDHRVDAMAGHSTGLNAFHWAANRGQLDTVKLLIKRKLPLETKSMYGGTVLGTAVWSTVNEPRGDHLAIIEALAAAGANIDNAGYPSGDPRIDEVLRRHGAK